MFLVQKDLNSPNKHYNITEVNFVTMSGSSLQKASAEIVADSLISWFCTFYEVSNSVLGRGTRFKNELVKVYSL